MKELQAITRAGAALAVSAVTLTIGSCLMKAGAAVLFTGIALKRCGRKFVEGLQR